MKKWLISCLALSVLSAAGAVAAPQLTAKAAEDETTSSEKTLDDVNFSMKEGASIRIATESDPNKQTGIRFSAEMSLEDWAWVEEKYADAEVSFGAFIMPASYQTTYGANLTKDSLFGTNATYYWDGKTKKNEKAEILQMDSAIHEYTDPKTQKVSMLVNGSIAPVKENNYNKVFVGICYMAITDDITTTYKMATPNDNERTIVYVAQKALEEEGWATTDSRYTTASGIISAYQTKYTEAKGEAPKTNYTVNKIYDDGTPTETTTYPADLNSTVTLNRLEYDQVFYNINEEKSQFTGVAYAQDKLVLNVYYEAAPAEVADKSTWLDSAKMSFSYADGVWTSEFANAGGFRDFYLAGNVVEDMIARDVAQLVFTFTPKDGESIAYDMKSSPATVPGTASINGTTATVTVTLDENTDYSNGLYFNIYTHGNGGDYSGYNITIKEVSAEALEKSTWLSSDSGRFASVTYSENDVWIATTPAGKTSNYYNVKLSVSAVTKFLEEGKNVLTFTFSAHEGSTIESVDLAGTYCTYPTDAVRTVLDNVVMVQFTLTEEMKATAPNMMFYFKHNDGFVMDIKISVNDVLAGAIDANTKHSTVSSSGDNTWLLTTSSSNWVTFKLLASYLQDAADRGVTKVVLTFANGVGSGFGFDLSDMPSDVVESGKTATITLDPSADYGTDYEFRFYQHDGGSPAAACTKVKITITES